MGEKAVVRNEKRGNKRYEKKKIGWKSGNGK